jgi:hypothetical protein
VARGIHFNQSLMKNKNFRNPRIYTSLVELVAINEIGSNFDKSEFFDFEGYGPESYATGIGKCGDVDVRKWWWSLVAKSSNQAVQKVCATKETCRHIESIACTSV